MTKKVGARATVVSVVGEGAGADDWVRALRGIEGVETERVAGCGEDELLAALSREGVDAVAFASAVPDLPGAVRRALMARRHVLVGFPVALSSAQLTALDELARRRGRAVVFDSGGLGDERLGFVRKMTTGPQGLWRPRYARSLRTGTHGSATLDELAISDLATVLSIMPGTPVWVSAVSPRADEDAAGADVAMATIVMDDGATVRVDVSTIEPWLRQEVVVACDGRTVVLDALDARAPLQIHAATRHRVPQAGGQWAETVSEHPAGDHMSREARAATAFVAAVRGGAAEATNASALAVAALAWEKARESVALGGEGVSIAGQAGSRPALQVIEGGGKHVDSDAPALKVIRTPRRA
jgi:predicted dehydrogenase